MLLDLRKLFPPYSILEARAPDCCRYLGAEQEARDKMGNGWGELMRNRVAVSFAAVVLALPVLGTLSSVARADACADAYKAWGQLTRNGQSLPLPPPPSPESCAKRIEIVKQHRAYNLSLFPTWRKLQACGRFVGEGPDVFVARDDMEIKICELLMGQPSAGAQDAGICGSGITGTRASAPASPDCQSGNAALADARAISAQDPEAAKQLYERAAEAFRRAGDARGAATALREAAALGATPKSAPPTAASVPAQVPQPPPAQQPLQGSNSASGPRLVRGVTLAQCSAMGGRITTYTNTAGRGPDVGECLVPPQVGANSAVRPVPQAAPAQRQGDAGAMPQPPDTRPDAQPAPPQVAALPPPQRRDSSGASGPLQQPAAPPPSADFCTDPTNYASSPDCYKYYPAPAPPGFGTQDASQATCSGGVFAPSYGGPSDCKPHWQGTDEPADCDRANFVERSSAAWGLMCAQRWQGSADPSDCSMASVKDRQTAKWQDACGGGFYYTRSPVSARTLANAAAEACRLGANVNPRQQQRCEQAFNVRYLLAYEPAVRAECTDTTKLELGSTQAECVDAVYFYGPGAGRNLSMLLRQQQSTRPEDRIPEWIRNLTEWHPKPVPRGSIDGCPIGLGIQPDPKKFGGSSCLPLDTSLETGNAAAPGGNADDASVRAAAEGRIDRTAQLIVAAVADRVGKKLSAEDRATCMDEAYAAARATLKGGVPKLSALCRELATAAVAELAFYRRTAPVNVLDPANDTLLSVLSGTNTKTGGTLGGNLGPPLPGMNEANLEPSAEERRRMDCVASGRSAAECAKTPDTAAPPQPQTAQAPPAADCRLADKHWEAVEKMNSILAYQDHLDRFPTCAFATLAKLRIEALRKKQ
jgi:hypothetical protein